MGGACPLGPGVFLCPGQQGSRVHQSCTGRCATTTDGRGANLKFHLIRFFLFLLWVCKIQKIMTETGFNCNQKNNAWSP